MFIQSEPHTLMGKVGRYISFFCLLSNTVHIKTPYINEESRDEREHHYLYLYPYSEWAGLKLEVGDLRLKLIFENC